LKEVIKNLDNNVVIKIEDLDRDRGYYVDGVSFIKESNVLNFSVVDEIFVDNDGYDDC